MIHPTIHIRFESLEADVDEKIASLILELWKSGIKTLFSCQDCGESLEDETKVGWAHIQFDPENLCKFLDKVQIPTEQLGLPKAIIHPYPFFVWKFEMYPVWDAELSCTKLITTVLFPIKDVDFIKTKVIYAGT